MKLLKSGGKLHWIKNLYVRWRDGAGCCDTFSLDYHLAKKILPALKAFRKHNNMSYPMGMSEKEWNDAIDEMIWAFQYLLDGEFPEDNPAETYMERSHQNAEREQKGFELFGKHFRSLWI